jgi:protein transport protein SEC20
MLNLVIGTSKQLITVLEKTDWLDRVLIISALVFFGLVVLFILKSRIIDRGLRITIFWTRLLPSSSARAGGEVLATASASGAAASATLASLIAGQHGGAAELIEPSMDHMNPLVLQCQLWSHGLLNSILDQRTHMLNYDNFDDF